MRTAGDNHAQRRGVLGVGSLPFPLGTKRPPRWNSFAVNKTGFENRLVPSGFQESTFQINPPFEPPVDSDARRRL
jgi:hypothetical protein